MLRVAGWGDVMPVGMLRVAGWGDVMRCAIVCYGASNKQAYSTNNILYGASCFDCIFQMN